MKDCVGILILFETWLMASFRAMTPNLIGQALLVKSADSCAATRSCWSSKHLFWPIFERLAYNFQKTFSSTSPAISFPAHRFPICRRTLSDNTGAESGSNKLWTHPLCVFLEKLCLLSVISEMEKTFRIFLVPRTLKQTT